jgi:hypothetical protein
MSRFLMLGITLALLSRPAAAQGQSDFIYDTDNSFHTYLLSPAGLDWQAAQAWSRTLGGHLVAINSNAEQALLYGAYSNHPEGLWIGLSDAQSEGTWVWDGGEPVVYANWCAGEPNNFGNDEDYGQLVFGVSSSCWNDISSPYSGTNSAPDRAIIEIEGGQRVNFDHALPSACTVVPSPLGASGDPDGISWNGAGNGSLHKAYVTSSTHTNWPVNGTGFLLVEANGPISVPLGGAFVRPAPQNVNEVRIPIPAGAKGVSYAWEFFSAEGINQTSFNDGMSIAVVDSNGQLIADLDYADTSEGWAAGIPTVTFCGSSSILHASHASDVRSAHVLPPLPYPAYLSICCWNEDDNSFSSVAAIDAIQFWGSSSFELEMSAPVGPGSIRLKNKNGAPGNTYVTAVTLSQGAFPNGWLFGVDIAPTALLQEIVSGVPFHGALDLTGTSTFQISSGVPPGLPVYAVSLQFTPGSPFGGSFVNASSPEFFLTQ